ncbi:hypothetical protein DICPUDRAFT_48776 [Dictyostelium purpureum]|uniref:UV excision repair protein RAD23 n=1 Tax=Dictyostelium purpureum TaxID=5786 RepID=F0ZQL0_DICPU|nr:uncharacterized protein DICPUDRAFT_48776 [Dictyostelium purpureum]EGC33784.1 hypothetical protein DICPUDRAFT_48776 [Dictyostelium purpureum]|eukprot:XP_003289709.1 hypothetical protein DICPUDRAFT_48776 [Dictyostelium purpureum]
MKLTIKNINKEVYSFELDSDKTVLDLKNSIFEKYNQIPSWQTLIYSGKILEDKNTLESYKISEQGFIVMMIKKPREAPATATTTSPSESTSSPSNSTTTSQPANTTSAPVTTPNPTPARPTTPNPTPTTSSTPGTTPSSNTSPSQNTSSTDFVTGTELENTIKNIVDMGFQREQVIRALRLGYNNADRAVELLLSGSIPENAADDEEEDNMDVGGGGNDQQGGDNPFEALRNHPYFPMLRQAIAQDPNIIPTLLQQLAQSNPELVRQISERPNDFIRIFQGEEGGNGGGVGGSQPGQFTIQVTREENDAIERLQQLTGLEKQVVIEAYFACDKNEELAASYLFEREDDE